MATVLPSSSVKPDKFTEPPKIGSPMTDTESTVPSSKDGEWPSHVVLGDVGEASGATRVESEGCDRLVSLRVEPGRSIDDIVAVHNDLFHEQMGALVFEVVETSGAGGGGPCNASVEVIDPSTGRNAIRAFLLNVAVKRSGSKNYPWEDRPPLLDRPSDKMWQLAASSIHVL